MRSAHATARLLAAPDGPRLAELDLDGWDTHSGQMPRLNGSLRTLDEGLPEVAGQVTTAQAMGGPLTQRLQAAGIRFERL